MRNYRKNMTNQLIERIKEFHMTEEYNAWRENPTEENEKKMKETRKQIMAKLNMKKCFE